MRARTPGHERTVTEEKEKVTFHFHSYHFNALTDHLSPFLLPLSVPLFFCLVCLCLSPSLPPSLPLPLHPSAFSHCSSHALTSSSQSPFAALASRKRYKILSFARGPGSFFMSS